MADWEPLWKSDPDPKPRLVNYETLDENTGETLFSVDVQAGGLIEVLQDDWLSKYTKAIYGDFNVYARFIRINPETKTFGNISNVDLIYEGETIIHVDSLNAFNEWLNEFIIVGGGGVPPELPDDIKEEIQSIYNWTTGTAIVSSIGWLIEFGLIGGGPVALVAGGGVLLVELAMGFVSAVQDIVDANNPELTAEQLFAGLYATTAWVYGDGLASPVPATQDDLGEFNPYIPQLPYPVPEGVAHPRIWFNIHGYLVPHNLGTLSRDGVKSKLGLIKSAWEDSANDTFERMDDGYDEATRVLAGGNPNLTLEEYRKKFRLANVPGQPERELTRSQFFEILLRQMLKVLERDWVGPTAPITLLKGKLKRYRAFYPAPDKR